VELTGKNTMVVGLGETGLAVVRFLRSRGANVRVNDQRDAEALGQAAHEAEALGAELVLGGHPVNAFEGLDLCVVSPGVPPLEVLARAEERGTSVVSEIELAARYIQAPIVAITGTNGKSTVTALIGEMCRRLDRPIFVGGNLGRPMIEAIDSDATSQRGMVIVELSSFQLERVSKLRVHVAVLLNVTPDHLDRYPSFEAYAAAKARIFERQEVDDYAVLSADAPALRDLVRGDGTIVLFGGQAGDVRVDKGVLLDVQTSLRVPVDDLRLRGTHNVANACAASLAARLVGVADDNIAAVLCDFAGLPHRMQYVCAVDGVEYIDDSKATNVGAAVASIEGLGETGGKVILIAGGVDKGGSYQPLRQRMDHRGRAIVVLGDAAPLIEEAFAGSEVGLRRAGTMDDAVAQAASLAKPGDTVLLAPACSSFDMFCSYAERGDVFQQAVATLGGTR